MIKLIETRAKIQYFFFDSFQNLFCILFSSRYLDGNPFVSLDDAVFSNLTSLSKL